ncbi:4a-hydroxytetrahydrobiopterin dehydratase [Streptomyces sp. NPDC101225]|uniref:4a-hydroxytetrahydrobiopterin dehydratase n=1 Tax=Streptomyces sp. NPDC101225 TaxID=3366135 RepID=UPI003818743A
MSDQAPLTSEFLSKELASLPGWSGDTSRIARTIEAPSFLTGVDLVHRVGVLAEALNHHPDIDIRWRRITFGLTTHDSGGVTGKDLALARGIDRLVLTI